MKLKVAISLLLVISMVVVPISAASFSLSVKNTYTVEQTMTEKMRVVFPDDTSMEFNEAKIIHDFVGNIFYVVECSPAGYFIYNPTTDSVVESSQRGVSPYKEVNGDLYYGGATYYYSLKNNSYTHTISNNEILTEDDVAVLKSNCRTAYNNLVVACSEKKSLMSQRVVESNDVTVYQPQFFRNLTHCGYIDGGVCGFIALGMLIAYKDKFIDDSVMNNQYWESGGGTLTSKNTPNITVSSETVISKKLYDLAPKDSTTAIHISDVCKLYLAEVGLTAEHTCRVKPLFTEAAVRNLIDDNVPVILFGNLPYQYQDGNCMHAVVAYGYSADKSSFIVHYGWEGTHCYTDVKVNIGYFGLGSIYAFKLTY